ncbi:MAG: permease [Gemmataceae bacterium]|nr:permease [Gemmataceae bacterium]
MWDKVIIEKPADPLDHITNFILVFRSIVWEALPFIVLGALIAGLLEELLPQRVLAGVLPRHVGLAVGMGGLLGLVFPMCECGIVPIMRRLLRKGLPLSCCIAYLLAGPIINVVVLLSTYAAFSGMDNVFIDGKPSYQMGGFHMVLFRAVLGYVVAVVTALIVQWQYSRHGDSLLTPLARPEPAADDAEAKEEGGRTAWQRLNNVCGTALHDFVDITVFLILGAALAAGARIFISPEQVAELGSSNANAILAILLMMGLAIVLCLCSEADAFVAASLVALRPSAKLAFLVLGPMLDFKLYAMYTRIFRPRLILTIYAAVLIQVFAYSVISHYLWEAKAKDWISPTLQLPPLPEKERKSIESRAVAALPLFAAPLDPLLARNAFALLMLDPNEQVMAMTPLQLEGAAQTAEMRRFYEGRLVKIVGMFTGNEKRFNLMRYKINCCAADATPAKVVMFVDPSVKESLPHRDLVGRWVEVKGRVTFLDNGPGRFLPALVVRPEGKQKLMDLVVPVPQPPDPFLF